MTIIEQIKTEIERRKGYISVTHFAEDLLSFLSTLESEKPMQEGLDEEINLAWEKLEKDYSPSALDKTIIIVSGLVGEKQFSNIARHFAQWGAEHLADARKTSPKGIEEAAKDFVWEVMENDENGISDLCRKLQYTSKISDFYDALAEFFIAGAKWDREQMMKDAIEATLDNTAYPTRLWFNTYLSEYSNNDKVRVIILPK